MGLDLRRIPPYIWYAAQLMAFFFVALPLSRNFISLPIMALLIASEAAVFLPVLLKKPLRFFLAMWSVQLFLVLLLVMLLDFQSLFRQSWQAHTVTVAAFVLALIIVETIVLALLSFGERAIPRVLQAFGASTAFIVVLLVFFIVIEGLPAFQETNPVDFVTGTEWRLMLDSGQVQQENMTFSVRPHSHSIHTGFSNIHATPGRWVVANFTVSNLGGSSDSYRIVVTHPLGMDADPATGNIILDSGESRTIAVNISSAVAGTYRVDFTATSGNTSDARPAFVDFVVSETGVDIFPEHSSIKAYGPNSGNIRTNLLMVNQGSYAGNFTLVLEAPSQFLPYASGDGLEWDYYTSTGVISLDSGEARGIAFVPRMSSYGVTTEGKYTLWLNVTQQGESNVLESYRMDFEYHNRERLFEFAGNGFNVTPGIHFQTGIRVVGVNIDTFDILLEGVEQGWEVAVVAHNGTILLNGDGLAEFELVGGDLDDLTLVVIAPNADIGGSMTLRIIIGKEVTRSSFGILPFIVGTISTSLIAIAIAAPLGIGCAAFLSEYCPDKIRKILRPLYELLAGIPSVIYGLWGFMVFGPFLAKWLYRPLGVETLFGEAILTASIVLSIMILPIIITLSEDSMRAVRNEMREGALALGTTRWQVIKSIIIPGAKSGITSSIILALGRAIGETMAVLMIMGVTSKMPTSIFEPSGTMTTVIAGTLGWAFTYDAIRHALFGVAIILFIMVFALNILIFRMQSAAEKKTRSGKPGPVKRMAGHVRSLFRRKVSPICCAAGAPGPEKTLLDRSALQGSARLRRKEKIAKSLMVLGAMFVTSFLFLIIADIIINGGLSVKPEYLFNREQLGGVEGGFLNAIIGSLMLIGVAIAFAAPLSIGAAIYINEYAKTGNRLTRAIMFASDTLASTPSIVFGAFGFMFFVLYLRFGFSLLAGGLTLGIMIIPLLLRSAIEALKSIPNEYREASLALGASKWQTIRNAVLPPATPMISSGVIISIGRAIGETAAILFTAGYTAYIASSIMDPVASMPNMIFIYYDLATKFPVLQAKVYSAAFVLIMMVLVLNGVARLIAARSSRHSRP